MGNYIYGPTVEQPLTIKILSEDLVNAKNNLKKTETIEKNIIFTDEESEIIKIKKTLRTNKQYADFLEELRKSRTLHPVIIAKQSTYRDILLSNIKHRKNILKHIEPKNPEKDPFGSLLDNIKNKQYTLKKIKEDGRDSSIKKSKKRTTNMVVNLFNQVKLRTVEKKK